MAPVGATEFRRSAASSRVKATSLGCKICAAHSPFCSFLSTKPGKPQTLTLVANVVVR